MHGSKEMEADLRPKSWYAHIAICLASDLNYYVMNWILEAHCPICNRFTRSSDSNVERATDRGGERQGHKRCRVSRIRRNFNDAANQAESGLEERAAAAQGSRQMPPNDRLGIHEPRLRRQIHFVIRQSS